MPSISSRRWGDIEDRGSESFQFGQDGEQSPRLFCGERGGRLIKDEEFLFLVEHLQNLEGLAITDPEPLRRNVRVEPDTEALAARHQFFAHPTAPNEAESADRLLTEREVLGDGQARNYGRILVNDMDSDGAQQRERRRLKLFALKQHLPTGRRMDAREYFYDGRLTCAVLAQQRVESPRF
jgi:hypothetical protein